MYRYIAFFFSGSSGSHIVTNRDVHVGMYYVHHQHYVASFLSGLYCSEQKHSSHFAALIAGLRDRSNKQETTEEEAGGVKGQVGGVKDESSEVNDNSEVLDQEWWDRDDEGAWLLGGEGSAPEDEEEEVVSEKRTVATSVIPER